MKTCDSCGAPFITYTPRCDYCRRERHTLGNLNVAPGRRTMCGGGGGSGCVSAPATDIVIYAGGAQQ